MTDEKKLAPKAGDGASRERLPFWAQEIISQYESGSTSQFILYGNVYDRFLMPDGDAGAGSLSEFILRVLLARFDVVLSYDLGSGVRVEKGQDIFASWPAIKSNPNLPREPLQAIDTFTHYFRYCAQLAKIEIPGMKVEPYKKHLQVACLIRDAHLLAPAGNTGDFAGSALVLMMREWATENMFTEHTMVTFLLAETLNDLNPLLVNNPRVSRVRIPLPSVEELKRAFEVLNRRFPRALKQYAERLETPARQLAGAQLGTIESLLKRREHEAKELTDADLTALKKELVEKDCNNLIEFIESKRTLNDLYGQQKVVEWLRQDIALWRANDLGALPMGYLLCGPVGTGKTFMVECLAGEACVPVVKLKNFRDRWVGSSEGNLEKIFRLLHALGRCIVFVDEADQALGRRDSGSGDSGVSGRIYGMIAEEMSNTKNRGVIMWVLASSRPDLIEVDLKRPGRVDVKIPLLPTTAPDEGFSLISLLCRKRGLELPDDAFEKLRDKIPNLLTPGAAEALAVKIYRLVRTSSLSPMDALRDSLEDYQPPVDPLILETQIRLAVKEASDLDFVPPFFRGLREGA